MHLLSTFLFLNKSPASLGYNSQDKPLCPVTITKSQETDHFSFILHAHGRKLSLSSKPSSPGSQVMARCHGRGTEGSQPHNGSQCFCPELSFNCPNMTYGHMCSYGQGRTVLLYAKKESEILWIFMHGRLPRPVFPPAQWRIFEKHHHDSNRLKRVKQKPQQVPSDKQWLLLAHLFTKCFLKA